jgi:hypothetical protein
MALKFLNDGYFAGKVGIGVEAPTYTLELQVSQPDENPVVYSQFGGNNGVTGNSFLQIGGARGSAASERYSYLQTLDGAGGFRILSLNPSGGNVGIGTTSPSNPLTVVGVDSIGIDDYILHNGDSNTKFGFPSNDTFKIRTSGVDRLNINSSGNVGIGVTGPTTHLEVVASQSNSSIRAGGLEMQSYAVNNSWYAENLYYDGGWKLRSAGAATQMYMEVGKISFNRFVVGAAGDFVTPYTTMILDSNGNVGIGTTSPGAGLQVAKGGSTIPAAGSSTASAVFGNSTSDNNYGVAIGANSSGVGYISSQRTDGTATTYNLAIQSNGGNVGIGTDSPGKKLDVRDGTITSRDSGNVNYAELDRFGGLTLKGNGAGAKYISTPNTDALAFSTNSSERMRITSTGNVGIKTTLPTNPLSINFAPNGISSITTSNNSTAWNTSSAIMLEGASNSNGLGFGVSGTANDRKSWIQSGHPDQQYASSLGTLAINPLGGNVGIGTSSPTRELEVQGGGNVYIKVAASTDNDSSAIELQNTQETWTIRNDDTNDDALEFQSDGGTQVTMLKAGNVGIGTTSPTQKLHVSGNARVTGAYYDSNNSPGTANQVLVSTATGTDWVDGSGSSIIGGPYLPLAGGTMTGTIIQNGGNIDFSDGRSANFGNGDDLQIYHDGSNSYITDGGTGNLRIRSTSLRLENTDSSNMIVANGGSNVAIYYNGSSKFSTTNTGVDVTGDIQIDSALLSNQENTDVDTGTETVASVAIATYTAAFFDFVIKKTTNVRSGTVYACHDGTNVEFTETSTQDLGDTSDVTLSVDISGGNMRLRATTTSDDWSIKSLIRAI